MLPKARPRLILPTPPTRAGRRGKMAGLRIEQKHHPPDAGSDLLEHLHPLPDERKVDEREAGDVPARTRQASDKVDWIIDPGENNRDCAGRLFQCRNDHRAAGGNEVRRRTRHLRRLSLHLGEITAGKPMLNFNVALLRPSERRKPLLKRCDADLCFWIAPGETMQEYDAPHAVALLRAR